MKIQYESPHLVIFESSLYRTTTTLVIGADFLLLVDPNWLPIEVRFIADYVARQRQDRQTYLLFTHSDYDHIIAYEQFADFTVIASQALKDHPAPEKVLAEIRAFDDENYIQRNYAITYPRVDLPVAKDGTLLALGEHGEATVLLAPGHNPDGIYTCLENLRILIVGDYLCNVEFPFIYHSVGAYRQSLQKLAAWISQHPVEWLIPGHGDATQDKDEMSRRISTATRYLDQLEAQVRAGTPFPLETWLAAYPWPAGLRKAHENNLMLARKEFGLT